MSKKVEVVKTWPDVASDAIEGFKTGVSEVASLVGDIASELSKAAPHIWKGLVEYHRWVAIGSLIETLVVLTLSIVSFVLFYKWFKKIDKESSYDSDWLIPVIFMMMILSVSVFLINLHSLPKDIADVVVPERKAAIEIINIALGNADGKCLGDCKKYIPNR